MTHYFKFVSAIGARAPKWLDPILLMLLILLAYANVYSNGYVWDDHYQIENNPYLDSLPKLFQLFLNDNWKLISPEIGAVGYWRPLYFVSY